MRDLFGQVGPALEEMRALLALFASVDDLAYYDAPLVLPNGDILLKRKADAPPWHSVPPGDHRPPAAPPDAGPSPDPERPWIDL